MLFFCFIYLSWEHWCEPVFITPQLTITIAVLPTLPNHSGVSQIFKQFPPSSRIIPRISGIIPRWARISRKSPKMVKIRLSLSYFQSKSPPNGMKINILISIFDIFRGHAPGPPEQGFAAVTILTVPKPPEIQPPPDWQHCNSISLSCFYLYLHSPFSTLPMKQYRKTY